MEAYKMKKFELALYENVFAKAELAQDTTVLLDILDEIEVIRKEIDYSSYDDASPADIAARNDKCFEIKEKLVKLFETEINNSNAGDYHYSKSQSSVSEYTSMVKNGKVYTFRKSCHATRNNDLIGRVVEGDMMKEVYVSELSQPVSIGQRHVNQRCGSIGIVTASNSFVTKVKYENKEKEYLTSYVNMRMGFKEYNRYPI